MRPSPRSASAWQLAGLASLSVACGSADDGRDAPNLRAAPIAEQEGAVCGMLVRDQSAPRGQVVHRDGSRFFFCSVGDLLVHRSAPSPHGRVEATFVEVMDPAEDPGLPHTGEHAWSPAENVTYVIGVERQGIMGPPVLVYRDPETAARVVEAHPGASAIGFDELVAWWNEDQAR